MNGELLHILESISREKGIDKEILIQGIEESLLSAARKSTESIAQKKNIMVQIDRKKGSIKAFAELTIVDNNQPPGTDEIILSKATKINPDAATGDLINVEMTPHNFGRIAAQSAKQIIIQKIREAERDVIFDEFKSRVDDITMGTVRRKEKGSIIVDLGRTEARLPLKEQCPGEKYSIGNRIRAYIAEVKMSAKGPEIILSRTHIGLIRRLFELEVPEIVEGTVEIKKIVREPGFRCKIAVHSHEPRVDPVGACVGMRGSRIKNIVRELENEKLDIVKWDPDINVYATNALSPAEIKFIVVNEEEKKLEIQVYEDQLSVAIGKRGQNVRLASKLISWEIDIRKIEGEPSPETSPASGPEKAPSAGAPEQEIITEEEKESAEKTEPEEKADTPEQQPEEDKEQPPQEDTKDPETVSSPEEKDSEQIPPAEKEDSQEPGEPANPENNEPKTS